MAGKGKDKSINLETTGFKVFHAFLVLFMVILASVMVYPYLNVLAKAFNEGTDTVRGGITIFPRFPTLENFITILKNDEITNSFIVSVFRVLAGTAIALMVQFSAAYAFKKKNLRGKTLLLAFLTIPMFFGGGLIPQYVLYSKLSLLNNFLVYILPGAFNLFFMIIIRTYLHTIPESFEESAKLDGANEIVIMLRIIVPLSMPILATVALWMAVGYWNDWTTSLYFVTKTKLFTLQFVLMRMLKQFEDLSRMIEDAVKAGQAINAGNIPKIKPESLQAAQIVITTIPIICVYPFLQKYFIKGIMIGAIKE